MIKVITTIDLDSMKEEEVIIGTIRTLEVGTTLEIRGMKVSMVVMIEGTLRIKKVHKIEVEVRREMTVDDFGEAEGRVDPEAEIGQTPGIKIRRDSIIAVI